MYKTKRAVLVVAVIMVLTTVVVAQTGFPDVPEDHPHRQAIEWSELKGAFRGYEDGTFKPDQKITAEQATIVFGRIYPDGVTRAEFAALLYVGRDLLEEDPATTTTSSAVTTTTVAPTTTPTLWSVGEWVPFSGEGIWGEYEGYSLRATSHSGYEWEVPPHIYVRCGKTDTRWNMAYITTPFLLVGDDDQDVWVTWRPETRPTPYEGWWWSDEESDSTLLSYFPADFLTALSTAGEGALYMVIEHEYDSESVEFGEILGIRGVLQRLDCWD